MKDILENSLYINDLKKSLLNINLSSLEGKAIVITGGLGLICSTIVDLLHTYNCSHSKSIFIYVADINEDYFRIRYGKYKDIHYLKYNALKPVKINIKADYIICGAGLASPKLYITNPVETMLSNFDGAKNLLLYAKKCATTCFLYISSSEVYGIKETNDSFDEDSFGSSNINNIRVSYSETKRASEVLCRSFSSEYGIKTVIVRPGHIYGPTASPADMRVSSLFAFKAARGESLEMKSSGETVRSYCYSIDCAVAILYALLFGEDRESYNIGHNEKTTVKEMARTIADYAGVDLIINTPSKDDKKQFNPMLNAVLNNEKIKRIGYKDSFSVKEGLTHTVEIIKQIYY